MDIRKTVSFPNSSPEPAREIHRDARLHFRYPITLDVEYRLLKNGKVVRRGSGKTSNISSSGVLFDTQDVVPAIGHVEVLMTWPFSLNGNCQLRLVMRGQIQRVEGNSVAVRAKRYEFRTGVAQSAHTLSSQR